MVLDSIPRDFQLLGLGMVQESAFLKNTPDDSDISCLRNFICRSVNTVHERLWVRYEKQEYVTE